MQVAVSLLQRIAAQDDDIDARGGTATVTLEATEILNLRDLGHSEHPAGDVEPETRSPRIEQRPRGQTRRPHGQGGGGAAALITDVTLATPSTSAAHAGKAPFPRTSGARSATPWEEHLPSKTLDLDVQLVEREAWRLRKKAVHEAGPLRDLKGGDGRSAHAMTGTAAG